jgi:hypothetical protein
MTTIQSKYIKLYFLISSHHRATSTMCYHLHNATPTADIHKRKGKLLLQEHRVRFNRGTFRGSLEHWIMGIHIVGFKATEWGLQCALHIKNLLCCLHYLLNNFVAYIIYLIILFLINFTLFLTSFIVIMRRGCDLPPKFKDNFFNIF